MAHAKGQLSDNDALEPAEYKAIRNALEQRGERAHHWRVLFDLLWFTGIRITEGLSIRRRDFVRGRNDTDVVAVMIHRLKKRVDRGDAMIPIPAHLGAEIDALTGPDPSAMPFARRSRAGNIVTQYQHLTMQAAWKALKGAALIAGVRVVPVLNLSTVRPHLLRHGFAQSMVDNPPEGLNPLQHRALVTAVLGHASEAQSERYYRRSDRQVQADWRDVQDSMLEDLQRPATGSRRR